MRPHQRLATATLSRLPDNVRDEEIVELEGLFRHLYRRDSKANGLNKQRKFHKIAKVRKDDFKQWDKA